MYRNLYFIGGGLAICLAIFLMAFSGGTHGKAEFVFNNGTETQTLDPGLTSGEPAMNITIGIFEGLTSYHPETLEALPGVAESWEIDGLTYRFRLRSDSYWTHRGRKVRPVVAEDFLYAWRRHFWPETGSEYSFLLHLIRGTRDYEEAVAQQWTELTEKYSKRGRRILGPQSLDPSDRAEVERFRTEAWDRLVAASAPSEHEIEVTLRTLAPYFLDLTSFYPLFPQPREAIEEHGVLWTLPENIVTNGPYFLEAWQFNSFIRMRRNPHYWETQEYVTRYLAEDDSENAGPPFRTRQAELYRRFGAFLEHGMETIDALAIEEDFTALNLYINGDIDRVRTLPTEVVGELIAASGSGDFEHLHHGPTEIVYYYEINLRRPVFRHPVVGPKLRKALALAIDRQELIDVVTRAHQKPAFRLVPPGIPGYTAQPLFGLADREAEIAEAKRLMAEVRDAGVSIPTLDILYNTNEGHAKIAAYIQAQWKRHLGIDVRATNQEWGVFLDSRRTGAFDIARAGWIGDYSDPNTYLDMFTTGNQNNDPGYENPIYDRIVLDYAPGLLEYLDDDRRREEMLADLISWPEWEDAIVGRSMPDGGSLATMLVEAVREFPHSEQAERVPGARHIRYLLFEVAETMLMTDMPVIPLYFYTGNELWPPELLGIGENVRQLHPQKWLRWKDGVRPTGTRYRDF